MMIPERKGIQVQIEVNIDFEQLGKLPPEVVTALMRGLAQVISAQQAVQGLRP